VGACHHSMARLASNIESSCEKLNKRPWTAEKGRSPQLKHWARC